jgi:anaerobic selenocysteine-containing dehydrogenase
MGLTVYWGFNAAVSAPHFHRLSVKAQKKGGSIMVIDPRDTETAQSADLSIQLAPGSDVALAYGVLKYVIDNDLVDYTFIDEYTYGFDKLKEEVSAWKEGDIEKYTGVAWDTVVELADLYTKNKNVTMMGIGMQKSLYGAEAVRAISLIPAVLGVHRGFYYSNFQGFYVDMGYVTGESIIDNPITVVSQVSLGDYLRTGVCKFVYIHNTNPAATLPNQKAVAKGLQREDTFVVVHDTHWTETAKTADLVLPAPTFLEKEDVVISYSHKYVRKSKKVIEPLGESKSELWVITQLAEHLQCNEWAAEDAWDIIETAFQGACDTGSVHDLKKGGMITLKMRPKNEYQTPTKKIELYATKAESLGVSPLPKQYVLPENGFIFLNSATKKYTHTQFQDVYGSIPPIVFINIRDAVIHNIQDTDIVELYNDLGSIKLKAVLSVSVPQNVLWAPRQGKDIEGTPQNVIIPDTTQKIGGGPVCNSTIVKIRRSQEK